ncbi:hypothetical protein [Brevibacillus reuszeri]|uniref:hypothetical protein n=1 Tax=Brevibacillus reuszeri TaxID=54915 RepID=UPI00289E0A37|nr:hypothetical protein [Brevibacillus reuszeri]
MNDVLGKLLTPYYEALKNNYDITMGGDSLFAIEPSPAADKDIQITLEDLDGTGVVGSGYEWRAGEAGTGGAAEVNELEITQSPYPASTLEVTFTNGSVNETATVTLNGTEGPSDVANAIAAAFKDLNDGNGIFRVSVSVSGSSVLFTSTYEVADTDVRITISKK